VSGVKWGVQYLDDRIYAACGTHALVDMQMKYADVGAGVRC